MRRFDRTALWFAIAGIVLMVIALSLNVNPADSSSVAPILRDSPVALPVLLLLGVTCIPAIFVAMIFTCSMLPVPTSETPAYLFGTPAFVLMYWSVAIVLQAVLYWLVGRVVGQVVRRGQRWMRSIAAPLDDGSATGTSRD